MKSPQGSLARSLYLSLSICLSNPLSLWFSPSLSPSLCSPPIRRGDGTLNPITPRFRWKHLMLFGALAAAGVLGMSMSGAMGGSSAGVCRKDLRAVTWNVAAVNNNPFEYWITHDDPAYNTLIDGVQVFPVKEPTRQGLDGLFQSRIHPCSQANSSGWDPSHEPEGFPSKSPPGRAQVGSWGVQVRLRHRTLHGPRDAPSVLLTSILLLYSRYRY